MIHTITASMYLIGEPCAYCSRPIAVDDLIIEDDHPVRHVGCGPTDSWRAWEDDDDV